MFNRKGVPLNLAFFSTSSRALICEDLEMSVHQVPERATACQPKVLVGDAYSGGAVASRGLEYDFWVPGDSWPPSRPSGLNSFRPALAACPAPRLGKEAAALGFWHMVNSLRAEYCGWGEFVT